MKKSSNVVFMTRLNRSKSTGMTIMTKIYRSEGVYKHNERFVFFTDKIEDPTLITRTDL
nr:MAG TPA: hypothetical protein [Caudoviricetes sp.]DAW83031.1 MAG TPA: hypothetical protein [Caudoviricetes sp.]DAX88117.1 MAG TPA: hypothetical protein [Caudoviricetes sp.]